ncbi:putative late blight resistance protein homolog R1B-13 [Salvia miltiorrhiza]|uniref:putative late blight resistance protein homolog R1B-13 n=1 Tax=Salvia miltiorrhiza TaxID=226208 RepID=UPI0025AD52C1|nr:putative late blight resistance protein homolog R1B-13 [Salvia miltiorrhiza]
MAAYAALVSLMHIIDDLERHHSPPISLNKQQVQSLTEIITFLQEFLEANNSPVSDEADPLEMRIADAAYAAEDAIESHIVAKIQLSRSRETIRSRFLSCFQAPKDPNTVSSNHDDDEEMNLFQDVQNMIQEMDQIKSLAMQRNTEKVVLHDTQHSFVSASSSTGKNSSGMVVWSESVVNGILERLVSDQRERQCIPITGMGGIGKTTLAKTVYSKKIIEQRFDVCAWATISQKYNTREILCELVSEATTKSKEQLSEKSEDELGLELYQYLSGRRFLIVMDDMWSIEAWDRIQRFFPENENYSRILVTTRLSHLSSQLNNNYSLQMEFLDEVRSWELFSKIVFGVGSCPHELEKIGKKIVENCRGLPLSIVVVGGILRNREHSRSLEIN